MHENKYAKGDLSMVKTNMQEMNLIQRYWQGI